MNHLRTPSVDVVLLGALSVTFLVPTAAPVGTTHAATSACQSVGLPSNVSVPAVSNHSATVLVRTSPQFVEDVSDQSYRFSGEAVWWQCGKPENIDANFIATNSSGFQEDVIAAFNISSSYVPTAVYGVSIVPYISFTSGGGGRYQNAYWSGYQFCNGHNSGGAYCANTPNILQSVEGTITQPAVYAPTGSNQPGCGTAYCNVAVWVGLDTSAPGGGQLLQTGSIGYLRLCPLCLINYALWWEDYPANPATFCSSGTNVNAGDRILSDVLSAGGNNYNVYTDDMTTGAVCSSPIPYTWSHPAYWGDFIVERGDFHNSRDLAKFDNFYLQGKIEYGNAWAPINQYYGNLWYDTEYMQNSGVWNVCSGSWSSPSTCSPNVVPGSTGYGEFYNTWISSQNT